MAAILIPDALLFGNIIKIKIFDNTKRLSRGWFSSSVQQINARKEGWKVVELIEVSQVILAVTLG